MESITSLKNAATRAIWGDEQAHQEPISGKTGDVSKGEPYDAGNMEPEEAAAKFTAPDETGTQPVEADTEQQPKNRPSINESEAKASSTAKGDSTRGQNDVRDPSEPSAHHEKAGAKENVDDSGAGLDMSNNPDKIDGPGPRPLEEVAKEQGGDAGKSGSDESIPHRGSDSSSEGGQGRHDSGTGEFYVRSSGLQADGGDFDAAAPGAGREADRLLEEKGLHPSGPSAANGHADGSASHHKSKTSLKTKIKAKLHRNSATAAS